MGLITTDIKVFLSLVMNVDWNHSGEREITVTMKK